jgi:hypothetical protein
MVYRGEQGVSIVDCLFKEPTWALDGPASNTLKFLTVAYHHLGEAGIKLIESTFDSIRKGQLPVAKRNSDST